MDMCLSGCEVRQSHPELLQCGSESLQGEAARADAAEARCQDLEAKGTAVTDRLQEAVTALQVRRRPFPPCPQNESHPDAPWHLLVGGPQRTRTQAHATTTTMR